MILSAKTIIHSRIAPPPGYFSPYSLRQKYKRPTSSTDPKPQIIYPLHPSNDITFDNDPLPNTEGRVLMI